MHPGKAATNPLPHRPMPSLPLTSASRTGGREAAWRTHDAAWALLPLDDAGARRLLEEAYASFAADGDRDGCAAVAASALILIASRHADYRGLVRWLERFATSEAPRAAAGTLALRFHAARMCLPNLDATVAFDGTTTAESAAFVYGSLRSPLDLPADERLLYGKLLLDQLSLNKDSERFKTVASLLTPALDDPSASAYWIGVWWWRLATSYALFGDMDAARGCRERAWQIARSQRIDDLEYALHAETLTELLLAGDLAAATDIVARMKTLAPAVNATWCGHGLVYSARYHLLRHEPKLAEEVCDRALALYAEAEVADRQRDVCRSTLAFCHVLYQDEGRAVRILESCLSHQTGGQAAVVEGHLLAIRAHEALRTAAPDLDVTLRRAMDHAASISQYSLLMLLPDQAALLFDAALTRGLQTDFAAKAIRLRKLVPPDSTRPDWPWPLRLRALGGFSIERDGSRVGTARKAQKKPEELLKALVVAGGDADIDTLVDQLWPSIEAKDPRASFEMALSRLRRLIGVDGALVLADGRLSLDRRLVWWDVAAFDTLRLRLHATLSAMSEPPAVIALAERLGALYAGPLFGGESTAIWSLAARERLAMAWQRAAQDAGEWLESRSEWRAATAIYERGVAQQMLAESLYRGLMRCHRALNERAEALIVYRRCRELLTRVLGVPPSDETRRLFEQIRGDESGAADAA